MPTATEFLVIYLETLSLDNTDVEALVLAEEDPIVGSNGFNLLFGMSDDNAIAGLAGTDIIFGGGGDDIIAGGSGHDIISAGDGDDLVSGGTGRDVIFGGAGNDTLMGNEGGDIISGGAGRDIVLGGDGNDLIEGGADNDTLLGGNGNDFIKGGDGDDDIAGNTGSDILQGGDGADEFIFGTEFEIDPDASLFTTVSSDNDVDIVLDFEVGIDAIRLFFAGPVYEVSEIDTNHDGNNDATSIKYESAFNANDVIDDSDPEVILLGVTGASAEDLGLPV